MKTIWISFTLLFSLALGSCGPLQPPLSTPLAVSPTQGESTQMTPSQTNPADSNLKSLIEKASEDLAQRLTVSTSQISVISASEVVWPDGSLGCPQKGMAYIQVLIPGFLIVLENDNKQYEYHSGKDGNVAYCQNPTSPTTGTPSDT